MVAVCPACGYPTIGPELCAFCRDVGMLTADGTFAANASPRPDALPIGASGMRRAS